VEECWHADGKVGERGPTACESVILEVEVQMKYLLSTVVILLAGVAAFSQSTKYKSTSEVPRISLEDAKKAYDDKSAIFIDARAVEAYKTEHVKGATNIPLGSTSNFSSLPKGKTIIVYCS
jgi:hypothetical protein